MELPRLHSRCTSEDGVRPQYRVARSSCERGANARSYLLFSRTGFTPEPRGGGAKEDRMDSPAGTGRAARGRL